MTTNNSTPAPSAQSSTTRQQHGMHLAAVTESAVDAIISANQEGHITSWNPAAEIMFGYAASEVIGRSLELIIPMKFRKAHNDKMRRASGRRDSHVIGATKELSAIRRDGVEFPIELSLSTWQVDDRRYFTGIIRDISERRDTEKALRDYANELEKRNRELVDSRNELARTLKELEATLAIVSDVLEGQIVAGRYRLDRKVESNRTGTRYEGTDLEQMSAVDVRVLRLPQSRHSTSASMKAARYSLPNAVEILDLGVADFGLPFVVRELLTGESLAARLLRRRELGKRRALGLVRSVCESVEAAHARGIVHGCLSPESLFLHRADTPSEAIMVLDYELHALTGHRVLPCSERYRPLHPDQGLPPETDVYSLAATLIRLLAGPDANMNELEGQIDGLAIGERLAQVLRQSLSSGSELRPSATELRMAIASELEGP